jgi:hypothetical protein
LKAELPFQGARLFLWESSSKSFIWKTIAYPKRYYPIAYKKKKRRKHMSILSGEEKRIAVIAFTLFVILIGFTNASKVYAAPPNLCFVQPVGQPFFNPGK